MGWLTGVARGQGAGREAGVGWRRGRGAGGGGGLSRGHWTWLENTGGHMWGVRALQEEIQEVCERCLVVPEAGAGGAIRQESLELEPGPRRRQGLQLEHPG